MDLKHRDGWHTFAMLGIGRYGFGWIPSIWALGRLERGFRYLALEVSVKEKVFWNAAPDRLRIWALTFFGTNLRDIWGLFGVHLLPSDS